LNKKKYVNYDKENIKIEIDFIQAHTSSFRTHRIYTVHTHTHTEFD